MKLLQNEKLTTTNKMEFLCDCQSKYGNENERMVKHEYCICYNYWYKDKLFCEECIGIVKKVNLECDNCKYRQDELCLFYPYPGYHKDDCNAESEHMCDSGRSCGYCYDYRRKIMDEIIYIRDIKMKENEAVKMPIFK